MAWPTTQYRGLDVLDLEPNGGQSNDTANRRSQQRLDPGPGRLIVIDRSGVPTLESKSIPFLLANRAEITAFRSFISNRKGRVVPFWNPTWQADLWLHTLATTGSTAISIVNTNYSRFQFATPARRDIAIIFLDHSGILYHRITAAVEIPGGTETLTLEGGFPLERDIAPGSVMISFLPCSRLAIDETPEFRWETTTVVEATLEVQSLPGDTPA